MGKRHWLLAFLILSLLSVPASAKVRDFQFIEDMSFAMPGELTVNQGLSKAEVRRTIANTFANPYDEIVHNSLRSKTVLPTRITYGFSDRFEISLEVPYVFLDNAVQDYNGIGDVGLMQKLMVSNQSDGRSWLSSAFGVRFEAPTGNSLQGLGNGKSDVEVFGIGMKEIGFTKWLVNLGYNFVGGEKYSNEFKYQGGVNAQIRPGFSFLMEFSGVAGAKDEMYLAPGLMFEIRGIPLRMGTQFGMTDDSFKYRWNFSLGNNF